MASSSADRLQEIYTTYNIAFSRRASDLKEAASDAEADRILKNIEALESAYLRAAKQALDATGAAVEQAYQAAVTARKEVQKAYKQATKLASRIKAVGGAAKAMTNLVKLAAK